MVNTRAKWRADIPSTMLNEFSSIGIDTGKSTINNLINRLEIQWTGTRSPINGGTPVREYSHNDFMRIVYAMKQSHNSSKTLQSVNPTSKLEKAVRRLQVMKDMEEEIGELNEELELARPKLAEHKQLMEATNSIDIGVFAKTIGWGRNKLFKKLRELKILMDNNLPYQTHSQYFEVIEMVKDDKVYTKTCIMPMGDARRGARPNVVGRPFLRLHLTPRA